MRRQERAPLRRAGKAIVWACLATCGVIAAATWAEAGEPESGELHWTVKLLTVDANEGCDVADFNRDGKLDVVAGRNWYAAPDFIPRPVRCIEDWNGYVQSNGDFAYDVDGDGWVDVISGSFIPTEVYWYRNPGDRRLLMSGFLWSKQLLVDTQSSQNEGQLLHDLDGDGVPEWVVNSWKKGSPMLVWRLVREKRTVTVQRGRKQLQEERLVPTMKKVIINSTGNGHGLGFGDVNGDGREDILCGTGWYERPDSDIFTHQWKFHSDWDLHASVPMLMRDLNGDGRNDLIWSKAHDFGIYWWEQLPPRNGKTQWKEHLIDDSWSQAHCLVWADIDRDGQGELVTGKRCFAHNGKDPGANMPPCLYYYDWDASAQKFQRHLIHQGMAGGGLQIRVADLNSDGWPDLAVAGKTGTYILFNQGR